MTEKITINGKPVWLDIEAKPVNKENPHIIPREYFTASYSFEEAQKGQLFTARDGQPRLFESPVEALEYAAEELQQLTYLK